MDMNSEFNSQKGVGEHLAKLRGFAENLLTGQFEEIIPSRLNMVMQTLDNPNTISLLGATLTRPDRVSVTIQAAKILKDKNLSVNTFILNEVIEKEPGLFNSELREFLRPIDKEKIGQKITREQAGQASTISRSINKKSAP